MIVQIQYFGLIAEALRVTKETITLEGDCTTLHCCLKKLSIKYPPLSTISFKVALNLSIQEDDITLQPNDQLALLPPFAGG